MKEEKAIAEIDSVLINIKKCKKLNSELTEKYKTGSELDVKIENQPKSTPYWRKSSSENMPIFEKLVLKTEMRLAVENMPKNENSYYNEMIKYYSRKKKELEKNIKTKKELVPEINKIKDLLRGKNYCDQHEGALLTKDHLRLYHKEDDNYNEVI